MKPDLGSLAEDAIKRMGARAGCGVGVSGKGEGKRITRLPRF